MATPLLILWCGHYLVSYRTAFFLPPEHDRDLSNLLNEKYLNPNTFSLPELQFEVWFN